MEESILSAPPQPSRTSFSSLPEDIVLSILARISTSHYPKLSSVSKSFRSLIPSKDLKHARSRYETRENRVYVCLQSHIHPCNHRWFTCCVSEDKTTRNLLVPIPSSYSPYLPKLYEMAGSDIYAIGGGLNPSSSTTVRVCKELVGEWREAPSMMVARKNAFTCSLNGKIYVIGGCESGESECWAEVFDPKTQTWEPLPDPGTRLRFSSIKNLDAQQGRIYLRTNKKNFVYLIEENRWEVVDENIGESECKVDNTWYCYANDGLHWWHETKYCEEWKLVKEMLDDFPLSLPPSENFFSEIWCAVVLLERRHDDEIWGQIEWVDLVLRVPSSHTLLRCVELVFYNTNESNPPQLPLPPSPPSMSLLKLLPVDIVLSTLARIPTSYYPTLCLVSKRFRSLIISEELGMLRLYLGTHPRDRRWFSMWTNPMIVNPYFIGRRETSVPEIFVYQCHRKRRKAPIMMVARKNPLTCSLDGKLYLWEVYRAKFGESICKIDEVWYSYDQRECWWYDTKCRKWRLVRGLTELCRRFSRELGVKIGSYGGKLVIFWVGPALYPFLGTSRIWCAVILLKKHCGRYNEVWGQVEWADIVLTAPWSHTVRLRCVKSVQ
ncbi:LOW QUALITY PROTEIN: hypothetical protein HID58_041145 [Brassica napus]|uniref:F-box domain-containing protein n=1 Tax=Brassica napus TaxID=3708 RepID=A0ABQ8BB00_BRANA|nr:LOW QUALITY PROTEIN: hypothetical protein HID58_041145 [Brassica napus]